MNENPHHCASNPEHLATNASSAPPSFDELNVVDPAITWKLALESSGEGVWDWDVVNGEQTFSKRWKEILGYAEDEIGKGYHEFSSRVHPEDFQALQASDLAYLREPSRENAFEMRMRCKDNSWKWILSRIMVIQRNSLGHAVHVTGTHTDISARKQYEFDLCDLNRQLEEKTKLLQSTLSSISQGILVVDTQARVTTYNARACELLDLPEGILSAQPTLQALTRFQLQRGDYGSDANGVDLHARSYITGIAAGDLDALPPATYFQVTRAELTLEIKTHLLPDGGMVCTYTDVTHYIRAEDAHTRFDLLLEATQSFARVGGIEHDFISQSLCWTAGIFRILETTPEEYTPTPDTMDRFFTPESLQAKNDYFSNPDHSSQWHDLELELITYRGRRIWAHFVGSTTVENGKKIQRTSVVQDITERKHAETALRESETHWKLALESAGDGVWDWHVQTGVEFFSKRLIELYGYTENEILSDANALDHRTHPDDLAQLQRDRQAHFDGLTPTYVNEHRVCCKNGSWKWVLSRGMVISRDKEGNPLRMTGTHTDITAKKEAEALIWQQAHFDALTGLPNRRMLHDRLEQEIKKCRRDGMQLAILFIDLDHFKEVNDTLGHGSGDVLLIEAARRLRHSVRESDTVARMGGDEFTIILSELNDATRMERVLQSLLCAMGDVFYLGDEQVFVSASIGITLYPVDGIEVEELFKNADQALYAAKGAGRNRFSFFTPALQQAAQNRVRMATDLRIALSEQQFRLVYQPIVELATGAIHKAEALIRWQHPARGLISPATFISIAESSGLIIDIGEWVFQQAAHQVKAWRTTLNPNFQISINKSPLQFQKTSDINRPWVDQLKTLGLPGQSIVIEITEGLLLDTSTSVITQLLDLHDSGIQVSLDDFGTGYSSLSYLQKFDIDYIKIDQSFVRHLIPDSTDLALCKAIIVMSHELGIKVIAEGVETPQQRDLLAAAGCDFAQGYLFAKPLSAPEFEALLALNPSVNS